MSAGKFVRFPDDLLRRIEAIAQAEQRTFTNVVRLLCTQGLDAREKPARKRAA